MAWASVEVVLGVVVFDVVVKGWMTDSVSSPRIGSGGARPCGPRDSSRSTEE